MNQSGFWWILLAGALFGFIHSFTASMTLKNLAARLFGDAGRVHYRLAYTILSVPTSLAYFALVFLLPDKRLYTIPSPWLYLTLVIQFAALLGLALSSRGTKIFPFLGMDSLIRSRLPAQKTALVTNGFYALTRHPIYFFSLVFLWFTPVMTWNLLALIIGVTLYILIGSRFEEQKLIAEYGQEYIAYRKITPWIIPIKLK